MKNIFLALAIFIARPIMAIPTHTTIDPAKGLILQNNYVTYIFEPYGLGLSGMIDRKTGFNHIEKVEGKHLLWEAEFGKGTMRPKIDNNYKDCSNIKLFTKASGDQIAILQWNNIRFWEEDSVVNIEVTIELPKSNGIAKWRIFVRNRSNYWGLWEVACPSVNGFPAGGSYDLALPVEGSGGNFLINWTGSFKTRSPSGFIPMQFMSFNAGSNAVYFSSMDGESWAKDFSVDSKKKTLSLVRYPENMGVTGSELPDQYAVAFGPYQGGWIDAAYRYRAWALQQKWTQKGSISQRPDFPKSAINIGFWIRDTWIWDLPPDVDKNTGNPTTWKRDIGDPHQMDMPFLNAMKRMSVPIAFQWYGWNEHLFDNNYPHFLPALSGFKERVKELVDSGALIVPYINGLSADSKIPDWDKYDPYAIKDEEGGLRQKFYWDGAGRLTPMCPSQVPWRHTISNLIDKMVSQYGINGIYVDEVSDNSHELCFNKDHLHPLGGGHYWADGYRDYYQDILNVAHQNGRDVIVTSEGADEIFFDLVNANLYTAKPSEREIPLQQVVYSGYTLFYGSVCDFKKSNQLFNYAVGQGFIDGRQIGWMDFDLFRRPEYSAKVDFLRQCARLRMVTQKFLTYGRLWKPLTPTNSVPDFEEEFSEGGLHKGKVPSVEARLWQSEDGDLAVFIANYTDHEIPFSYAIDPSQFGLSANNYTLSMITPEKVIRLEKTGNKIKRTESMEPNTVKVIEIAVEK
ncbi:hypothetical protein FW778_19440 [Ginsengibacter hankyongi]|uniref:DUF6259 domain-containing protein n=1 Tax=Ginsengibacter hankyongi TaxID=2607284 RepID=A0A5J5IG40_9BACT|nr:DUF6259 domain-containing protein [Ginsengibacter hankyongi]KAA9036071.1 hypothetical protein FW778_19440 [Ginsengibacter hankyongi]